jgi:hypothetical protein
MLDRALGGNYFQIGVQNYLNKYAYQNTLSNDFWAEITAANPNVKFINIIYNINISFIIRII